MKEASGEANMTIITIVLIGIVVALGTPIINNMMKGASKQADCAAKGECVVNGSCAPCPTGETPGGGQ